MKFIAVTTYNLLGLPNGTPSLCTSGIIHIYLWDHKDAAKGREMRASLPFACTLGYVAVLQARQVA
eukprot:1159871-Pelagomonas_calceolata.AAC.2